MIKISGPKKEIDGFIDGDTLCFSNVNTAYDSQEIGYTRGAQLVRVQIEIEKEPTVGLFVGGTRYGVAGEETDIIDDDGAVVLVGDVVTIAWTCGGTQLAEIRPVLKGHKQTGESVFFVGGFFQYFAEEESVLDAKLKVVIPYNEVPCGMIIGNVKYVKS